MARRSGFGAFIKAAARVAAASQRESQRAARRQLTYARQVEREEHREAAQRHRDQRRLAAQQAREDREAEKALKAQYLQDRQTEADDLSGRVPQVQGSSLSPLGWSCRPLPGQLNDEETHYRQSSVRLRSRDRFRDPLFRRARNSVPV